MGGLERRSQVLGIAAVEFADHGLHGASIDAIAHTAGITQAYVFRMFGTKKALFLELVGATFDRFSDAMPQAAMEAEGLAFGMLLNNVAALDIAELDEPWAKGVRAHHHRDQPVKVRG
ncbi:MAG TPA: TetR/AcrR family transcriptional regulator [Trebonia sp.]